MKERFRGIAGALVFGAGALAPIGATAQERGQTEWDLAREAAVSDYHRAVNDARGEAMSEIISEREGLDITRGLSTFLERNVDFSGCVYNPRNPGARFPSVDEIARTTALTERYGFWARSLAREEVQTSNYARGEVAEALMDSCREIRDAGSELEGRLIDIREDEADSRR